VTRRIALASSAVLALSVVLLPWYALDSYEPNGWDATWWARGALAAALVNMVALRAGRERAAALAALIAAVLVLVRVAAPPDFGFAFDGLDVPVERRGCWVALTASLLALLASARLAWRQERPSSPEPAAQAPPPAPSSAASGP
jgi:hypothetical protein